MSCCAREDDSIDWKSDYTTALCFSCSRGARGLRVGNGMEEEIMRLVLVLALPRGVWVGYAWRQRSSHCWVARGGMSLPALRAAGCVDMGGAEIITFGVRARAAPRPALLAMGWKRGYSIDWKGDYISQLCCSCSRSELLHMAGAANIAWVGKEDYISQCCVARARAVICCI